MKEIKKKKCRECKIFFIPQRTTQIACSAYCAYKYQSKLSEKKEKEKTLQDKKNLLTHKDYLKILQVTFNTYIRKRDELKGCISCGVSLVGKKFDAGHYFSVGGYPNVRFDEMNVHGQCVYCNQHNHGNIHAYSERLPSRIGLCNSEDLKIRAKQEVGKLTIDEIKEKIKEYKLKIKNQ